MWIYKFNYHLKRNGDFALTISGYSDAAEAYYYFVVFEDDIVVTADMKIGYWIYHETGSGQIAIDGQFTDHKRFRDFYADAFLTDQFGVRIHPAARRDPVKMWHYIEVSLEKAAGKTIDFIMFGFDNGNNGYKGQFKAYIDDFIIY